MKNIKDLFKPQLGKAKPLMMMAKSMRLPKKTPMLHTPADRREMDKPDWMKTMKA